MPRRKKPQAARRRSPLGGGEESHSHDSLVAEFFDERFYRDTNTDIDFGAIAPLPHFMSVGWRQGRDPAAWFSVRNYLASNQDVVASEHNPFWHYLRFGREEKRPITGAQTKRDVTIIEPGGQPPAEEIELLEAAMHPDFYRAQAPDVDFASISTASHYAAIGWREGLDPSPEFSTSGYLAANSDVAAAGVNPFLHFLTQGHKEGRMMRPGEEAQALPSAARLVPWDADGVWEWSGYQQIRDQMAREKVAATPDPAALGFVVTLLGTHLATEMSAMRFSRKRMPSDPLIVSIVIPCFNEELMTAECLASVCAALPATFAVEILIADNGSTDELYAAIAGHRDLRYVRLPSNIGFGAACNAAADLACGEFLLFLNNDAQIAPGCLEALVAAFDNEAIGIAGPKLLGFDGRLQEAGCLLESDGSGHLIGFSQDSRAPRFSYQREVEHVSGAAIMIRRSLFRDLGGFDPLFAPAYCEDADLSLKIRRQGRKVWYVPNAVVAHHLSRTSDALDRDSPGRSKLQRIAPNRQRLKARWLDTLTRTDLRTIAFYLPQYHPIPQNDLWWGKGFTEWINVGRAKPNFAGHDQPRLPADLGYYDLRVPEIIEQQAALARRYGVTGFCYYYYRFGEDPILEMPIERMLATGQPDLPFCLCWANENWSRRWDGSDGELLLAQSYAHENALKIIDDLVRYFRDGRYIQVDGRPLILIYRIKSIPHPKRFLTVWRNRCRAVGIGEICIAMVESFDLSARPERPDVYGCDISVEFPAHGMVNDPPKTVSRTNPKWTGAAHDYRELALAFMRREEPGFHRIRSVLVGWDSTPRHPDSSLVLEHATPGAFQAWLEWTYRRTMEQNHGSARIVFICAWNEWCEGCYLEPDRRFGHAYLQAVRNALDCIETRAAFAV